MCTLRHRLQRDVETPIARGNVRLATREFPPRVITADLLFRVRIFLSPRYIPREYPRCNHLSVKYPSPVVLEPRETKARLSTRITCKMTTQLLYPQPVPVPATAVAVVVIDVRRCYIRSDSLIAATIVEDTRMAKKPRRRWRARARASKIARKIARYFSRSRTCLRCAAITSYFN